MKFTATVMLDGSSNFTFHGVTLDGGATEEAALQIHGQGARAPRTTSSSRTRRSGAAAARSSSWAMFAPSDAWNHHLTFVRDDITCGSHNCFQISGGRDMVIDGNRINGTTTAGVLTAGATRVSITRNRMKGMAGKSPCATQIASPGMEWDNYAGVENMISSAIVIANNVVDGWGTAVQLDAARDVAIVHNTVADGTGVRFNHRMPHDQMGNVILERQQRTSASGTTSCPSISLATGEMPPGVRVEQRHLEGRGRRHERRHDGADVRRCHRRLRARAPAAPASTPRSSTPRRPLVDFENRPRGAEARRRRPRARRPGARRLPVGCQVGAAPPGVTS